LFGLLADRMRRGWLVALGPTLTVAAMGAIGLAPSYAVLVILLLLAGLGTASFHPQAAATAGFASGPRKGAGLSLFVAGGELGFALGPIAIALVVSAYGLSSTWIAAVPGLLVCWLLWANITSTSLPPAQRPPMEADEFRRIFRALALLWLIVVFRSVLVHSYTSFLPLLLAERGASILAGGAAVFVFGGIGTLGGLMGGPLSDRIGRRATLVLSFVIGGPALFAFTRLDGAVAFAFLGLGGMALYLSAAVTVVMAQELLPHRASMASSIVMGLAWGTAGLTLTGTGALADSIGLTQALTGILILAAIPPILVRYLPAPRKAGQP
jgi:FSR family fosmidomycin resistance protein-like MFS transporter